MKQIIYIICFLAVTTGLTAQTVTKNYILTRTYTKDDGAAALDQIQYLDGLGRPVQTVQKAITPNSADLANYTEYDGLERAFRQWLPIVSSGGGFVDLSSFSATRALYEYDTRPYTETHYEASPLNRVDWEQGPGAAWQGHAVSTGYGANASSSEVKRFTVSGTMLINSGYYSANTLYKTTITDEDGKPTIEYKDKLGQVIMKRAITDQAGNHDTYYVYNDLGQLCYVLPPLAADASGSADAVNKYGYVYRYDPRGNCTYKKLPGCEPVTMTYYPDDLLKTSQDGNQLGRNESLYYEYDELKRLIKTSLVSSSGTVVLTENYYDNYNFIVDAYLDFDTKTGYGSQHPSVKGLMTGMRVRILDNTNRYLLTANYYDYKGQLVQSRSTNHLGGYDFVYNAYDFTGHVTKNLKVHDIQGQPTINELYDAYDFTGHVTKNFKAHSSQNTAGQTTVNELYDYRYDHAGRLDTTIYTLNDKAPVVLAANTYDDLGRLIVKLRHTRADREEFDYNIRNWITHITSGTNAFEENLYYTQSVSPTANGCYNGNIAQIIWKYKTTTNNYKYSYDKLNRFTWAVQFSNNTAGPRYSETFTYDKMGNITALTRFGSSTNSPIDYITTMIYNGNQVTRIDDPLSSQNSYSVKEYQNNSNANNEMTYDVNGNLTKDLDRKISKIRYNILNLPDTIDFSNNNRIINTYTSGGLKLSSRYITDVFALEGPILADSVMQMNRMAIRHRPIEIDTTSMMEIIRYDVAVTNYIGNIEYESNEQILTSRKRISPKTLKWIYNNEGYADGIESNFNNIQYNYYRKDHLGNNREVWLAPPSGGGGAGTTVQRTQYYPSGLPWASNSDDNPGLQNKKYNGKEFVEMHGYDTYDYGARGYYAALGRWTSVDPLAEKHYDMSPYAYCMNNPVKYIDPLGLDTFNVNIDNHTINRLPVKDSKTHTYVIQNDDGTLTTYNLEINDNGQVLFPEAGFGFNRYGGVDEDGDHYLTPEAAAATLGLVTEVTLSEYSGAKISFGDMSDSKGGAPSGNHDSHGGKNGGSGVCIDYRYTNEYFLSKQGTAKSSWFDAQTNKTFLDYAKGWGFTKNYISPQKGVWKRLDVNGKPLKHHENHGHLTYKGLKK